MRMGIYPRTAAERAMKLQKVLRQHNEGLEPLGPIVVGNNHTLILTLDYLRSAR
jgi:hypothetical protein